jgi:nitroreductase
METEAETMAGLSLDVMDAIYSTRATRYLKSDPIDETVIWRLLDAAIRGPSSGNGQRWGWIVVRDAETKRTIGAWYLNEWLKLRKKSWRRRLWDSVRGRVRGREPGAGAQPPTDVNFRAGDHLAHHLAEAPVWIIPVLRNAEKESTLDGADIYGAVQNLLLAARKHGLGSTLTMLHTRREADVRRLLGLPQDCRTMALIPLGYPARGSFSMPRRLPVESVTHWERWGNARSRDTCVPGDSGGVQQPGSR